MKTKPLTTLFLLATLGVMGQGCNLPDPPTEQEKTQGYVDANYTVVVIEGCEYLKHKYRSDAPLIHKGNCKNPIHKVIQSY